MFLPSQTVAELKRVVKVFAAKADIPKLHAWKRLSDDEIWRRFIVQVAVVGNAESGARLARSLRARKTLALEKLVPLSFARRRALVNKSLRDSGFRYSSQEFEKCRKTSAVTRNFDFLSAFPGGPKGYIKSLLKLPDDDARAARVAADMAYIKLKGARDLLVELGVVSNVVALDTRILNILEHAGAVIPRDIRTNQDSYKQLQNELLTKICKPLGITGAALDRILFQNYKDLRPPRARPNISANAEVRERACVQGRHESTALCRSKHLAPRGPRLPKR
jgi:hypothetical protein